MDPLAADAARTWSLVADVRAWLLILALAAVVLGRSGVLRSRWLDLLKPYRVRGRGARPGPAPTPTPDAPTRAPASPLRDPLFLFLLVIASVAVTAWIVTKMTVASR